MAAILHGSTVSFGGSVTSAGGWGSVVSQGETIKQECDSKEIVDANGNAVACIKYNQRQSLSVKCYLASNYPTATGAGSQVSVSAGDSDMSGNWLVDSVSKTRAVDDVAMLDLELSRPNFL